MCALWGTSSNPQRRENGGGALAPPPRRSAAPPASPPGLAVGFSGTPGRGLLGGAAARLASPGRRVCLVLVGTAVVLRGLVPPPPGRRCRPVLNAPAGAFRSPRLPPAPVPAAPPGSPVRCAPGARLPPALLGSVVAPPAGAGSCLAGVRCRGAGAARLWLVPAPGGCVPRSGPRPPPPLRPPARGAAAKPPFFARACLSSDPCRSVMRPRWYPVYCR